MKFENTEVWGFKHAMRGMRNPKESWDKGDTHEIIYMNALYSSSFDPSEYNVCRYHDGHAVHVTVGPNDMKLAQTLIRAGTEHRKFLRQIFVSVDITAPIYWWKEFSTYRIGVTENSTSTMHKITSKPITKECFEMDDYDYEAVDICDGNYCGDIMTEDALINTLENLRKKYLETKDKKYWKELIRWLPESWLQTRTVTMNYENLLAMCSKGQRRFHKLNEWSGRDDPSNPNFISWARMLPYAQEFIFIDEEVSE